MTIIVFLVAAALAGFFCREIFDVREIFGVFEPGEHPSTGVTWPRPFKNPPKPANFLPPKPVIPPQPHRWNCPCCHNGISGY